SLILTLIARADGYARFMQPLSTWLLFAPYFLGISVALLMLGWTRHETRKDWWLASGLCLAWAGFIGHTMGQGLAHEPFDASLVSLEIAAFAGTVLAILGLLVSAARHGVPGAANPRQSALGPGLMAAALLAALVSSWMVANERPLGEWIGSGMARIVAALALAPALWHQRNSLPDSLRAKIIPISVAGVSILIAAILLVGKLSSTYGSGFALASLVIIGSLSYFQLHNWLFTPPTLRRRASKLH
ncbi:MAG: hypothetical protein LC623_04545, partial [Halobacteriales archaeon]|nr:hypothetical protein [Halobacteriales archaeon]